MDARSDMLRHTPGLPEIMLSVCRLCRSEQVITSPPSANPPPPPLSPPYLVLGSWGISTSLDAELPHATGRRKWTHNKFHGAPCWYCGGAYDRYHAACHFWLRLPDSPHCRAVYVAQMVLMVIYTQVRRRSHCCKWAARLAFTLVAPADFMVQRDLFWPPLHQLAHCRAANGAHRMVLHSLQKNAEKPEFLGSVSTNRPALELLTMLMDIACHLQIEAEKLVLAANGQQGLRTIALRPSGIFGEGDPLFVPSVINNARKGKMKFIIGSGRNLMDFTYVGNVAYSHILVSLSRPGPPLST